MAKILVVDDEKDVLELLRFVLEKDGHQVITAEDGREGLEAARRERPDMIVLDIMMPQVDGYTVSIQLKQFPETANIPVVVLTAKGKMREIFEVEKTVSGYFDKPFDPKELRDFIASELAGKAESN